MTEDLNRLLAVHMEEGCGKPYFEDINEALRVADKLQMKGFGFKLKAGSCFNPQAYAGMSRT